MQHVHFLNDHGDFRMERPENYSYLYFPLASETGLKSAVTPQMGGDSKTCQEHFLLEPVSADDLHNKRSTRAVWVRTAEGRVWSANGISAEAEDRKFTDKQDESDITAGLMWQTLSRTSDDLKLRAEITSFVPVRVNAEVMIVSLTNTGAQAQQLTVMVAVPIYGRSADNIRDHRHVTSMLHRIRTNENGVIVTPTMSFDERGHRRNTTSYFTFGYAADGSGPEGLYPTLYSWIGEGGSLSHPAAVYRPEVCPARQPGCTAAGEEAMGGLRFAEITLDPGACAEYIIISGISDDQSPEEMMEGLKTGDLVKKVFEETRAYWQEQVNVRFHTGDPDFDRWMRWVSFQPFLRRLFGCSFLPHHDYGRGGRGWRDLWQDCLSLLIMDPSGVRDMIVDNCGGVRIDGTNATIIGDQQGEFIADRNGIARVWMDHAFWPFMTVQFYIDQTGDVGVLMETAPYFKDPQSKRGTAVDNAWEPADGLKQRTDQGQIYEGTVLEHLLVENLAAFFEVGTHNMMRLRGADWNDALDMANDNGESVAFTAAYAGNLRQLAKLLTDLQEQYHVETIDVAAELEILMNMDPESFEDPAARTACLETYLSTCAQTISGRRTTLPINMMIIDLEAKADWLMDLIRGQEWIRTDEDYGWFNSYYDNSRQRVEGPDFASGTRMMLTGQVFTIMSGTADDAQVREICRSADRYLFDEKGGGYRLNTDFHEVKMDMGRMFGFAYGEKENGAVFSHMAVMYANALYRRGFARAGWKSLKALYQAASDLDTSRIYPGIPEYFRTDGRGVYHYLTGAASWYMMTLVTQVFGIRGQAGDLLIEPGLLADQFDAEGTAKISLEFAGRKLQITLENPFRLDPEAYTVQELYLNDEPVFDGRIFKEDLVSAPEGPVRIRAILK